ncbi:MAG TPA: type II toxin-antitoxin system RelE/ParE family toxin [Firmicutes bacterium]|jgi:toxin ParE1/3/4|nr:type II toxin-antitoxin system RelE/ParE family toxin [Bacillota bacterium]
MSEWTVVYTEHAERDLRSIFQYIAFSLLEPKIARNQLRRIMDAVAKLDEMPLRYHLYKKEPWHSKGLRVLPIDNYLTFYLPIESKTTVAVIRIMYGGRDIEEQLRQTETGR